MSSRSSPTSLAASIFAFREGTRATIAISNGDLFIRTPQALYCVGK